MIELIFTVVLLSGFMAIIFYVRTQRALKRHRSPVMTCHERSQCCGSSGTCGTSSK